MRFLLVLCCLFFADPSGSAETLVLAYPERQRMPFMAESPNDEGIYREIFSRAAAQIGAELTIVRLPKRRIFQYMREGRVDAYPGSFAEDRVSIMNWMEFGVMTREVCITRIDVPLITSLTTAPPLRLVHEIGDSRARIDSQYPNIKPVVFGARIDVKHGLELVKGRRGDLFIIEEPTLNFYLKTERITSLAEVGLLLHSNCIEGEKPLLLGISRASKWYGERPNPGFDRRRPFSPSNLPTKIDEGSRAGRLSAALKNMIESGEIQRILSDSMKSQ